MKHPNCIRTGSHAPHYVGYGLTRACDGKVPAATIVHRQKNLGAVVCTGRATKESASTRWDDVTCLACLTHRPMKGSDRVQAAEAIKDAYDRAKERDPNRAAAVYASVSVYLDRLDDLDDAIPFYVHNDLLDRLGQIR